MIRLSGPATREVLALLLDGPPRPFDRGCAAARLRLGGATLPILLVTYRAPASYTGEDAAEILLPGNPTLVERILTILNSLDGVRLAAPGEFTARAYLNDRLTLDQAEGVAATIAAESREQLDAAGALLAGRTGAQYRQWADELATLLALVEAGIDFTDQEDVVPIPARDLAARLAALDQQIAAFLGAEAGRETAATLPRVVLAGAPNAGKSTLFNALLGRRRAVVSPVAGTTRDVLEEELDLSADAPGCGAVLLTDLAGLDAGAVSGLDAAAQARARESLQAADVVVHCDPSGRFAPLDVSPAATVIRVRTKADLPAAATGADPGAIAICALDGWNLPILRRAIADVAWGAASGGLASLIPRHRRALDETRRGLRDALEALHGDDDAITEPALVASSLRAALDALGELVGRITPDEVIGRIFATFCVGK